MEILRSTFRDRLPDIERAIEECNFIAIDTEFTGLDSDEDGALLAITDSVQQRYEKLRRHAADFIIAQFGLCTFRWDADKQRYEAKPFNVYLMPAGAGVRGAPDRLFQCQPSTMEFLARNAFDFTKWLGYGVHFMNWSEEETYRRRREMQVANELPDIDLDDRGQQESIDAWVKKRRSKSSKGGKGNKHKHDDDSIYIQCANGYQYRIVYQLIRSDYPKLDAEGQRGFIRVTYRDVEAVERRNAQRRARMESDIAQAVGFRSVIDMLARSGKPIIGHHVVMDLSQIYHSMYKSLPEQVEVWASGLLGLFPMVLDTKLLIEHTSLQPRFADTRLEDLAEVSSWPEPLQKISIVPHEDFTRYKQQARPHEAGYDAFLTGSIFIRMHHHHLRNDDANLGDIFVNNKEPEAMSPFTNHLYFVKSNQTNAYQLPQLAAYSGQDGAREMERFKTYFARL